MTREQINRSYAMALNSQQLLECLAEKIEQEKQQVKQAAEQVLVARLAGVHA